MDTATLEPTTDLDSAPTSEMRRLSAQEAEAARRIEAFLLFVIPVQNTR